MNRAIVNRYSLIVVRCWTFIIRQSLFIIPLCVFFIHPYKISAADMDPLYWSAEENLRNQHYDSAIFYFDQIIQRYPLKKEAYFNRGLAFYHSSKFPEAIADFDQCLKMDSSFKDAQYMKAIALEKKGNLDQAIAEFEKLGTYKEADKRIKNYRFSVYLSENWYYMIAILLLVIVLLAVVSKMWSLKD